MFLLYLFSYILSLTNKTNNLLYLGNIINSFYSRSGNSGMGSGDKILPPGSEACALGHNPSSKPDQEWNSWSNFQSNNQIFQ